MKRRSKTSAGRPKARARKTTKPKRGTSSKRLVRKPAPVAGQQREIDRLVRELKDAREQQTAISEVLQIIASSNEELTPVFETIVSHVTRLCEATFGTLSLYLGEEGFRSVATNTPAAFAELRRTKARIRPRVMMRVAETKRLEHILDMREQPGWQHEPDTVAFIGLAEARTVLCAPVLKNEDVIGVLVIYRNEVQAFTDDQIALVQNFAAQAGIAMENARLLNELRARTEDVERLNQHLERRVADQVGEIERMSRLRRFLPPQVADLIVASGSEKQLESHRREITALFCDLRGFTGFTESADAEDVMALLRDYHAAIGQLVVKYSGTLERYAGDGVMVIFNDPVPVENPPLQAVLTALELRNALGALIATWRRLGHEIGFGVGIAHGFATLGTIGFEGRFDYAAIGTVSNVACRLCDEAKPGQILISPRVLMKVEHAVTVEPVGEFALKGIRRPLTAYNVLGPGPS
jgi:class 3 adenylate cyclase